MISGLGPLAIFARYTRAGMLDELASDYVRTVLCADQDDGHVKS